MTVAGATPLTRTSGESSTASSRTRWFAPLARVVGDAPLLGHHRVGAGGQNETAAQPLLFPEWARFVGDEI